MSAYRCVRCGATVDAFATILCGVCTAPQRLPERPAPLLLTPPAGEPELPGMAEWRARQKQKAAADLLRREIESFAPREPGFCDECGYALPGHDWECSHVPPGELRPEGGKP